MFKRAIRVPPRTLHMVRPGVEAALLAAVALGCAQAGWSVFSPHIAHGSAEGPAPRSDASPLQQAVAQEVRSPFVPEAEGGGASHAAAALLSGVKLAGLRVSADPARSGAILTLNDGGQHAFLVGQEVSAGVRLVEVRADYVLLSHDGGQTRIAMEAGPSFSFARALMGQTEAPAEAPAAPAADARAADDTPTPFASSAGEAAPQREEEAALSGLFVRSLEEAEPGGPAPSAGDAEMLAWLSSTIAQPEKAGGRERGWRVQSAPPRARAAGLRDGDLIVAVNGLGPSRTLEALSAAAKGRVELSIVRGAGEAMTLSFAADSPA